MTDLKPVPTPAASAEDPRFDLIELFFFAYRDFVSEADHVLLRVGFGRAHHRVLHFIARHPGITVADLLDILQITKQSLARVLRELIQQGYVEQTEGRQDRRQRLLWLTPSGQAMIDELVTLQSRRIRSAMAAAPSADDEAIGRFLFAMIDPEHRDAVQRLFARSRKS
jgi:DNA-binding MarR family transcriptional regulator